MTDQNEWLLTATARSSRNCTAGERCRSFQDMEKSMKSVIFALLMGIGALLAPDAASAQAYAPGRDVADTNPEPTKLMCWNGTAYVACANASGIKVAPQGSQSIQTGQVAVGTTAVRVVPSRSGRSKVTFSVTTANTCALGAANVTLSTGFRLQPIAGASIPLNTGAEVWWICSAANNIDFVEEF